MRTSHLAALGAAIAGMAAAPVSTRAQTAPAPAAGRDSAVLRGEIVSLQAESGRKMDMGKGLEVALQRAFLPFLQGEIAVGYSSASTSDPRNAPYPDPVTYNAYIPVDQTLTFVPVTFAVRGMLPADDIVPFVVAGAGLFFTKLEDRPSDAARKTISDRANPFGYFFGVGAHVTLSSHAFASLEGRYQFVSRAVFFNGDRWSLNAVTASLGLAYRF